MITKKVWNSFTDDCRKRIIEAWYGMPEYCLPEHIKALIKPYNHNFDFSLSGKRLKEILSDIKIDKNGNLSIALSITPEYEK